MRKLYAPAFAMVLCVLPADESRMPAINPYSCVSNDFSSAVVTQEQADAIALSLVDVPGLEPVATFMVDRMSAQGRYQALSAGWQLVRCVSPPSEDRSCSAPYPGGAELRFWLNDRVLGSEAGWAGIIGRSILVGVSDSALVDAHHRVRDILRGCDANSG